MTALYRRYRPQDFDEVVGQEAVVRTLRHAIEHDRVRQAYLFAGPRGTGKTSLARILAKALNCVTGPTTKPCNQCNSCRTISTGTSLDVIEMDAASQRGIDDIREIRDRVILQPVQGRHKIYILDEAHQLTDAAFNALLKLIEEPPPHLVFVFCTTELDKMLKTVRSRCQTFTFARPRLNEITRLLRRVADGEAIDAPDAALALVARSAGGSYRDAVSTFDQLASATEGAISVQAVLQLLGAVEEDALFRLMDLVVDQDSAGALSFVEELAEQGQDMSRLVLDLLEHLRHLMLVQHLEEVPDTVPVTEETRDRLRAQANQLAPMQVLHLIDLLAVAVEHMKEGGDPRLPLELALVKATRPRSDPSREAILVRLEQLEARATRAAAPTSGDPGPEPSASSDLSSASDPVAAEAASQPDAGAPGLELAQLRDLWQQAVLPSVQERSIPAASMLGEARPVEVAGDRVVIEFPPYAAFHRKLAEEPKNAAVLREVLFEVTGRHLSISFSVGQAAEAEDDSAAPESEVAGEDEFISLLTQTFDAREVTADPRRDSEGTG